jgi:hypothetical protein
MHTDTSNTDHDIEAAAGGGAGWVRTAVADTSPTIAPTAAAPAHAAYTSISAARTVTGTTGGTSGGPVYIIISDESGSASSTNTISFTPSSGTIDGQASKVVVATGRGWWMGYCNGTNWFSIDGNGANNPTNAFGTYFTSAATANRIWTFPDVADTAVGLAATQTVTNKTLTTAVIGPRGIIHGSGTAPTMSLGAAAGSTATKVNPTGTDSLFKCSITPSGSGITSGTWATITFNGTWGHAPICFLKTNTASPAANVIWTFATGNQTTTTVDIINNYNATGAIAQIDFFVCCFEPPVTL